MYVLILVMSMHYGGTQQIESYNSLSSCQNAAEQWVQDRKSQSYSYNYWYCVKRDNAR